MAKPSLKRVREVFSAAAERPEEERRAVIEHEAGGDADLVAEVEALLESLTRAGGYLDAPAPGPSPDHLSPAAILGSEVGPYRLVEVIGEGGFGAVYLAEQSRPIARRVALKIIKAGMDSRDVLARFDAERQALARMDHPNIARVLEAGSTGQGRPYFVMELVNGPPITRYCDERRLTPRRRLELFVQVCRAVQHAHQKGVIHRDLKPANVLVAEDQAGPVPKVIDFGIAKAISGRLSDATIVTGSMHIVGTPAYMSPEQAELSGQDVDTRSDVYALGVIMYELLTGGTPHRSGELARAGASGLRAVLSSASAVRPSTRIASAADLDRIADSRSTDPARLGKMMRGELDWIVMRAIERDRSRRYDTAEALAADVLRHLAGEPVLARPPSTWYLLRTFSRRHRGLLLSLAAVAGALVFASVVSTLGFLSARRERDLKDAALVAEARQRESAQRLAYRASIAASIASIEAKDSKGAIAALSDAPEALRGWEWRHLWARSHEALLTVRIPEGRTSQGPLFMSDALLAVGGEGTPVRLLDLHSGRLTSLTRGPARGFAASIDRRRIAALTEGGTLQVFEAPWAAPVWSREGIGQVSRYPFTLDGEALAVLLQASPTVVLLAARDGAELARTDLAPPVHTPPALLATTGAFTLLAGPTVRRVALAAHTLASTGETGAIDSSAVPIADGRYVSWSYSGDFGFKSPESDRILWRARSPTRSPLAELRTTPDGRTTATSDRSGAIATWSSERSEPHAVMLGASGVTHIEIDPTGRMVAAADATGAISIFDTRPAPVPFTMPYDASDHRFWAAFAGSGSLGVASSWGSVEAFNPATGERLWTRSLSRALIPAVAVSAEGRRVAAAGAGRSGRPFHPAQAELFLLDGATGEVKVHLQRLGFVIWSLAEAPGGGAWLAACEDGVLRLLDGDTGAARAASASCSVPIGLLSVADAAPRAVTLNGLLTEGMLDPASSRDEEVTVWDARALSVIRVLKCAGERTLSAALSADGRSVAAVTTAGTLWMWDVASGDLLWTVRDLPVSTASLTFAPDGRRIAVASADATVRIIDTRDGSTIANLPGVWPTGCWRFVHDGQALVGAGRSVLFRLYESDNPDSRRTQQEAMKVAVRRVHAQAAETLARLEDPLLLWEDRAAAVESDSRLDPATRSAAAERARRLGDRPNYMNSAATTVSLSDDADPESLRQAARAVERAAALRPGDWAILNTLGSLYFRLQDWERAEAACSKSGQLRSAEGAAPHPCDELILSAVMLARGDPAGHTRRAHALSEAQRHGLADDPEFRYWAARTDPARR